MKFELAKINKSVCVCVFELGICEVEVWNDVGGVFLSLESVKLRFGMMWVVFFELGISEFLKLQLGSVFVRVVGISEFLRLHNNLCFVCVCVCVCVRRLGMCEF